MERVDVAIVGGGPAGASAAEQAAAHGAETVLFEQGVPREDRESLGPDSTDAAGMLDYWIDIMDYDVEELPDDVILRELTGADFLGPSVRTELNATGIDATYDGFGFTFHRARMDDWLHERAAEAGADLRVGTSVKSLETDLSVSGQTHTLTLSDGDEVEAEYVVLADGPQRRVTLNALDQFMPAGRSVSDHLSPPTANHIAYQEYREFPEELFAEDRLVFWWGWIPGETAYPWVFPNDGTVGRVGLTMPIGMSLDDVEHPESYKLLRPDDETIPTGSTYVNRLLETEFGDEYDIESDIPIVEDRGKSNGTETYPISSTRPIDSPVGAGIAVAGGAMGTTSAFHEGGYHVAVRTGKIAGRLAATGGLDRYNEVWKRAVGSELLLNISYADIVADYTPDDWDRVLRIAERITGSGTDGSLLERSYSAGLGASKLFTAYKYRRYKYRNGRYVQLREDEYEI